MKQRFDAFLFDIHDVLLTAGFQAPFRRYLKRQALVDPRIDLADSTDVYGIMGQLMHAYCPLCEYTLCQRQSERTSHLKKALSAGEISYAQLRAAVETLLPHTQSYGPQAQVLFEHLVVFLTDPELYAREISILSDGADLLQRCVDRYGLHSVFIFSNCSDELYVAQAARFPGLFAQIPRAQAILSSDAGLYKPEKAMYEYALKRLSLPPERILFFDDSISNVQMAREVGMHAVLVDPKNPQRMQKECENLGL